jgi:hypothetical protein
MYRIGTLFVCLIITACSSTKVHLYTHYLSDAQVAAISSKLEASHFEVQTNTLSFPQTVEESTLIYSPLIRDKSSIERLTQALAELGWNVSSVQPFVKGNHWYKQDSVGLLLLPEGIKQQGEIASQDLAHEYVSRNCDTSELNSGVKIQLNRDNTYQMFFTQETAGRTDHLKGFWKLTSYPYMELSSQNERWLFYFEIEQKVETDKVSNIDIIELKPADNYKLFPACSFVFGIRV